MLNEDQTDNSDKAVMAALAAGILAWLIFKSFIFALIAGWITFVVISQKPGRAGKSPENFRDNFQEDN